MSLLSSGLIDIKTYYVYQSKKNGYKKVKVLSEKEVDVIQTRNKADKDEFDRLEQEKQKEDPDYKVKKYEIPEKYNIQILNTKWKEISWDDQNKILKGSMYKNDFSGNDDIDNVKYNDILLKSALVEWDLKDDMGNPIPCHGDMIGRLPYVIVRSLMTNYERIVFLGEEEEKKS